MTVGKSQDQEQCVTQVLERHCELAPMGWVRSDGSSFLLTYLLFLEDQVSLDPP